MNDRIKTHAPEPVSEHTVAGSVSVWIQRVRSAAAALPNRVRHWRLIWTLVIVSVAASAPAAVVVEDLTEDGAAARAGLERGDRLVRWMRAANPPANPEGASGELSSPLDLEEMEAEQVPRGAVTLVIRRQGELISLPLPPGDLGIEARPDLTGAELVAYEAALREVEPSRAATGLTTLAESHVARGEAPCASWLLHRASEVLATAGAHAEAEALHRRAVEAAGRAGDVRGQAWLLHLWAGSLRQRQRVEEARAAHERALQLRRQVDPDSLAVASSLHQLGVMDFVSGDLVAAEARWLDAMEIRQRLAPGSLALAASFNNLGVAASYTGRPERSEELNRRCLAIRQELVPESMEMAQTLTNLGIAAFVRGDTAAHERYQRRALEILDRLAPDSLEVATAVHNLGGAAYERGDLNAAEHHFRRALAIREKLQPDSLSVAGTLNALAMTAIARGDLAAAERLNRRALELRSRLAPGGMDMAESLITQGTLALELGRLETAEESFRQVIALLDRVAPGGWVMGSCLSRLGRVLRKQGDWRGAEALQTRALETIRRVTPGDITEAEALHELGLIRRRKGERAQALALMMQALSDLEAQGETLGGATERRAGYRERHMDMYRDAVQLQVEGGHLAEAFAVLERSRAHAQLAMLAERDLMFAADIPAELEQQRRRLAAESDQVLAELADLRAWSASEAEPDRRGVGGLVPAARQPDRASTLEAQLQDLRREQEALRARIRDTSPRLAAIRYPRPLDLEETLAMLDPGSVLLVYSIAETASYLFVIEADRGSIESHRLNCDGAGLRAQVEQLRSLIQAGRGSRTELDSRAAALGASLLGPAAQSIARARRLLIMADGPLHYVPFAALADPIREESGHYLIERCPLSMVSSATVLAQLKKQRRKRDPRPVIAVADPLLAGAEAATPPLPWVHGTLDALPASLAEVEAIARTFPDRTTLWTGAQATEERLKGLSGEIGILHLAVHGIVDENLPMESGLVLASSQGASTNPANGFLQVWEIFDQMRLDADLVTLSACDTALGRETSGEGLMGLSQAFIHAGARAVVASLWSVADHSTGQLMHGFYDNLRSGMSHDQALRRAQLALLQWPRGDRGEGTSSQLEDLSHPFSWAAFQLMGDWK